MLENEGKKKYIGRRYRNTMSAVSDYIKIADQLCYPKECVDELMESTNELQCEQILAKYRKRS